jgi:hypothetical protein
MELQYTDGFHTRANQVICVGYSRLYVGEADILCRRIGNYLTPGPSQKTNIRLHNLFKGLVNRGCRIRLEILEFLPFYLGDIEIDTTDLHSKLIRRFIEHMLAAYYSKLGYELINA